MVSAARNQLEVARKFKGYGYQYIIQINGLSLSMSVMSKDPALSGSAVFMKKMFTEPKVPELAKQLNATGRVRAVLSRDHDVYHKLQRIIRPGRKRQMSLFRSLTLPKIKKHEEELSVFTLSEKAFLDTKRLLCWPKEKIRQI